MFAAIAALALQLMAAQEPPLEAPIPQGAVPTDDPGRYRLGRSYEEALDFYRRLFNQTAGIRWRSIVNLPTIKAKHIECLRKKSHWEGINIYEKQGEVRIYVIPRDGDKDAVIERKPRH